MYNTYHVLCLDQVLVLFLHQSFNSGLIIHRLDQSLDLRMASSNDPNQPHVTQAQHHSVTYVAILLIRVP